jgi:hypothetical protein
MFILNRFQAAIRLMEFSVKLSRAKQSDSCLKIWISRLNRIHNSSKKGSRIKLKHFSSENHLS